MQEISPKSRLTVTLLAYFLGALGVHRFYLGKIVTRLDGAGTGSVLPAVLTICAKKSDIDRFSKGDLDFETFQKQTKVLISYLPFERGGPSDAESFYYQLLTD